MIKETVAGQGSKIAMSATDSVAQNIPEFQIDAHCIVFLIVYSVDEIDDVGQLRCLVNGQIVHPRANRS